jgi:ribosomal protein S18 acetylase RimI-like enzyme
MDPSAPQDRPHVWLAEAREAPDVARLLVGFRDHLGFDWPSGASFLASVERLMGDPATEYLLGAARADEPAAGVVQLRYRWAVWRDSWDCLLEDLFVAPRARRSGLGRALVAETIARARMRGCRRIELDTAETNTAARALYESMGFDDGAYEGGRSLFLRLRLDGPTTPAGD